MEEKNQRGPRHPAGMTYKERERIVKDACAYSMKHDVSLRFISESATGEKNIFFTIVDGGPLSVTQYKQLNDWLYRDVPGGNLAKRQPRTRMRGSCREEK